jgi:hypothetical protein
VQRNEKSIENAIAEAARAEILLPAETGMLEVEDDRTFKVSQKQIAESVDVQTEKKV